MGKTDKVQVELGRVQETLLLPLWGRAGEKGRKSPIVDDPFAVSFMDRIDYDFTKFDRQYGNLRFSWAIRAYAFDKVIKDYTKKYPEATIINLGAGLDTTFSRVDNGRIKWFDVDLPDTMAFRRKFIKESDRRRFITGSLLETDWMEEIPNTDKGVLFLAAGLLMYFTKEQIEGVFANISRYYPESQLFFDIFRIAPPSFKSLGLKWSLKSKNELIKMGRGINVVDVQYYMRLFPERWSSFLRFLGNLPVLGKMGGALYQIEFNEH